MIFPKHSFATLARGRSATIRATVLFAIGLAATVPSNGAEPFRFPEGKHGKGELKYRNGLPVMILEGSPEEIGEQHAALTVDSVKPVAELPKQIVKRHRAELAWPLVVATARHLVKNSPERYRRELKAAVAKSGIDEQFIVVANGMLELRRIGGCSAYLIDAEKSATGGPLFGRNFDFPPMGVIDKYSLVIVFRPEGRRPFVSVSFPSLGGVVSGMNDRGLALATLDVYSSKDGSPFLDPRGTPLAFCFRRILEECDNVEQAERLMKSMKPTTWMNLAVCDKTRTAVFEITPKNVVVRKGSDGRLSCTNHFRTDKLSRSIRCRRYAKLASNNGSKKLSVSDVGKIMHSVNQGDWTMQTMVFEPTRLRLHLSIGSGPASARPLKTLELAELFKRGS